MKEMRENGDRVKEMLENGNELMRVDRQNAWKSGFRGVVRLQAN